MSILIEFMANFGGNVASNSRGENLRRVCPYHLRKVFDILVISQVRHNTSSSSRERDLSDLMDE